MNNNSGINRLQITSSIYNIEIELQSKFDKVFDSRAPNHRTVQRCHTLKKEFAIWPQINVKLIHKHWTKRVNYQLAINLFGSTIIGTIQRFVH